MGRFARYRFARQDVNTRVFSGLTQLTKQSMRTSFKVAQERKEARNAEKVKAKALAVKGPGALAVAEKMNEQARKEAREAQALALRAGKAVKALEQAAKEKEEQAAKEKEEQAWRDLKLPVVKSYALCDEPHEVAECKAFADAMYQRITGKPYRSQAEAAAEKAANAAASSGGAGGVGK